MRSARLTKLTKSIVEEVNKPNVVNKVNESVRVVKDDAVYEFNKAETIMENGAQDRHQVTTRAT